MTAALTLAAIAITLMSLYSAARARRALYIERRRRAPRPPVVILEPLAIERAAAWPDDGSDGDPTWWIRATMYGHDPDLSARERYELAPLFDRFDRLMTAAFARLDTIGVTA